MSLKFGIYLVEQRIISPEQFCGLVKIQQESMMTLASIGIRKNALTIRQVSTILDLQEQNPEKLFGDIALELNLIDRATLNQLLHAQQATCPSVRQLLIECGLLTPGRRESCLLTSKRTSLVWQRCCPHSTSRGHHKFNARSAASVKRTGTCSGSTASAEVPFPPCDCHDATALNLPFAQLYLTSGVHNLLA